MANKPNIRFGGFTEKWKEAPLGQLVKEHRVSNQLVHHQNLLSLSYGKIVRRDIRANKGLLPASFDTYQIIDKDTIVFRVTDLQNDKKSLRVAISEEEGIISPAYVCVDTNSDEISASFMHQILHYHDVITKLYYKMGDGLRQTLNYGDLKCIKILYPKPNEQKAIAEVFRLLNSTITQREKELEKLKNIKRALLEKLFPQNGEKVPALRFKEFTREWEEKKADDIFVSFYEKNHPELPVLSATQDRGMVVREDIGYSITHNKSNEVTYKRVLPGQFVIHLRSFQGGFAHSNVEGITSPAYDIFGFRSPNMYDDYFWKYIFSSERFIKRLTKVTYGIRDGRNVNYNEFLELQFLVPSFDEQQKIARLITILSNLLSLREKQLTLLKHTKQALLEQMFVNE